MSTEVRSALKGPTQPVLPLTRCGNDPVFCRNVTTPMSLEVKRRGKGCWTLLVELGNGFPGVVLK